MPNTKFLPRTRLLFLLLLLCCIAPPLSYAQDARNAAASSAGDAAPVTIIDDNAADQLLDQLEKKDSIAVAGRISDPDIQARIFSILKTSEWFGHLNVTVTEGIVIIAGESATDKHRQWAENIASRTEGVVAVINKLTLQAGNENALSPVIAESNAIARKFVQFLPTLLLSLVVLVISVVLARYISSLAFRLLGTRVQSTMLKRLIAKICAVPLVLIGTYIILQITGLGTLAATIIGGTGLVGLIIGFAFRDIAENFLASILISIQRPFRLGDTIKVLDYTGIVQAVTTRGTVLMTLDGNHVQIPNSSIYKEPITNFSANPNIRQDFTVGIGYDAVISHAQATAMKILREHPAVLNNPEPWVLAEQLAASTVNIRIYFWVNAREHNALKVKSSVIRMVKYGFIENGVSMPDDAREVIFPEGINVISEIRNNGGDSTQKLAAEKPNNARTSARTAPTPDVDLPSITRADDSVVSTAAEGALTTDKAMLENQAEHSTMGDEGTNLLQKPEAKS